MLAFTILLFICFATISTPQWIQADDTKLMFRSDGYLSVGCFNGSIYLLGGFYHAFQLTEYVIGRDLFIDHGLEALKHPNNTNSFGVYGYSDYWTQINHVLYVREAYMYDTSSKDTISIFNMKTKTFTSSVITDIPTEGGLSMCMTSNSTHIFLLGGDTFDGAKSTISLVQIYDLSTNEWITSAPSMNSARSSSACIIHPITTKLYAIGGIRKTAGNEVYLSSIEMIESSDIARKTWTYINGTLLHGLASSICDSYKHNIYVIGGIINFPFVTTETVHIINTLTDEVSVLSDSMPTALSNVAPIVVNHTLFVFGGLSSDNTAGINTWMMYDLYKETALPTEDPTSYLPSTAPTTLTLEPSQDPMTLIPTNMNIMTSITTTTDSITTNDITDIDATEQIPPDASDAATDSLSTQYDKDVVEFEGKPPRNVVIIATITLAVVIVVISLVIVNCVRSKKQDKLKRGVEFMKRADDKANNNNNDRPNNDAMMGFDIVQPVKHEVENSVSLESVGITQEGRENVQTETIGIVNDLDDVQECETNPDITSDEFIIDGDENYPFTTVQ